MEIKEAIEWLNGCIVSEEYENGKPNGNITCDLTREVLSMAISALKKQVGKQVVVDTTEEREYFDHVCPHCKTTLQQYRKGQITLTYKPSYCHFCGQKIDWEVTE